MGYEVAPTACESMSAHQLQIDSPLPAASDAPVSVRVYGHWDDLAEILGDWNSLLQRSAKASIFQTPEWLGAWWQAFGANKELQGLVFTDSDRKIVGIAPFYVEQQSTVGAPVKFLRMLGAGSGDSDALDFIVAPGNERQCANAFVSWLASQIAWDICALETLRAGSLVARHIAQLVHQAGWRTQSETTPNFFIELPPTWAEYLDTLEPSFRPLLTRYPKRLQSRYRVSMTRCEGPEDLDHNLQTLFVLHQMRWTGQGEPGAFATPERREFYSRMARAFQARGWLEFWMLQLEGETVAAQFCFRYGGTVYLLQEGFNPKYAADKIGYALRAHVLQEMIRTGADRYDFMGGADAYKSRFGACEGSYLTLRFAGPSRLGRLDLALREKKREIKSWLKRKLPERVLELLRSGLNRPAASIQIAK
ncbi:MAG TPA: GNAT family N-acetyltransferase [Candidatus Angelobacter sp.]|nr:GNAT family N-acetyltransferase [Candidatus Angelobacter sp.]